MWISIKACAHHGVFLCPGTPPPPATPLAASSPPSACPRRKIKNICHYLLKNMLPLPQHQPPAARVVSGAWLQDPCPSLGLGTGLSPPFQLEVADPGAPLPCQPPPPAPPAGRRHPERDDEHLWFLTLTGLGELAPERPGSSAAQDAFLMEPPWLWAAPYGSCYGKMAGFCLCVCVVNVSVCVRSTNCLHPSLLGALAVCKSQTASLTHAQLNCLLNCHSLRHILGVDKTLHLKHALKGRNCQVNAWIPQERKGGREGKRDKEQEGNKR